LLVLSALMVYVVTTLCGLIPVCIVAQKVSGAAADGCAADGGRKLGQSTERIISLCNCMAGGVFIAMSFLGLLPYSQHKTSQVLQTLDIQTDFPVAEFLSVMGFFVMMSVEQGVVIYQKRQWEARKAQWEPPGPRPSRHPDAKAGLNYYKTQVDESCSQLVLHADTRLYQNIPMKTFQVSQDNNIDDDAPIIECVDKAPVTAEAQSRSLRRQQHQLEQQQLLFQYQYQSAHHRSCHQHVETLIQRRGGLLRLLLLYLALSIHSLFEGLALGLQTDQLRIFHLFFAILFHEALVAFSVGITLARQQLTLSQGVKYVLLFSTAVPIGIVTGVLVQQVPSTAGSVASAVLQSLATGIFVHVTFLQLIPAELADGKHRLLKVLFHFLGFLSLALVTVTMGSHR